ncbi:MAG: LytR C-terminal domain-containing protein [Gemmatimonadaceae bacterium]|nr:LytR C-terminal domain-containing protein [Gemmatimonadaceae bacterium]
MNTRALVIGGSALALVLIAGVMLSARGARKGELSPAPQSASRSGTATSAASLPDPKWAKGQRITVEVLNATRVRGLARRAALTLRDQGFDVVSTGTNREQFDTTQVLDRTGHRDWAALAARSMGGGTVLVRPDSSREVDLTVLIGTTWRPPSQPFYP